MRHTPPMTDSAAQMLDALNGEWRGSGTVETPAVAPVDFVETIRFSRRSETSLDYWQRAEDADAKLLHSEAGIWRLGSEGRLELTIALPGSVEVAEGEVADGSLETTSTSVGRAATSTRFVGAIRRYRLDGDVLDYDVDLASTNFPMSFHLRATLRRVTRADR